MHMTDFAYDGPIFLVILGPSYLSSPVLLNHTLAQECSVTFLSVSFSSTKTVSLLRRQPMLNGQKYIIALFRGTYHMMEQV